MKLQSLIITCVLVVVAFFGGDLGTAQASVTLTASSTVPTVSANDQYNFTGGGLDQWPLQGSNSSNNGMGQTFTTGSGGPFALNSFSFQGFGNYGSDFFTAWGQSWSVLVSSVSGTTYTPLLTVTGIANVAETGSIGTSWFTWSFDGADLLTLDANTTYAVQILASQSWFQFAGAPDDSAYLAGNAIKSSTDYAFSGTESRGYDHVFTVSLSAAVPEPSTYALLFVASGLLIATRFRRTRILV